MSGVKPKWSSSTLALGDPHFDIRHKIWMHLGGSDGGTAGLFIGLRAVHVSDDVWRWWRVDRLVSKQTKDFFQLQASCGGIWPATIPSN